jgi:hypothetical protein
VLLSSERRQRSAPGVIVIFPVFIVWDCLVGSTAVLRYRYGWLVLSCRAVVLVRSVVDRIAISALGLVQYLFLVLEVLLLEGLQLLLEVQGGTLRLLRKVDVVDWNRVVYLDRLVFLGACRDRASAIRWLGCDRHWRVGYTSIDVFRAKDGRGLVNFLLVVVAVARYLALLLHLSALLEKWACVLNRLSFFVTYNYSYIVLIYLQMTA